MLTARVAQHPGHEQQATHYRQTMYFDFFGLTRPPFRITPDTAFFFAGGGRGDILEGLVYAVAHGEGIVRVTGEVGSGKTMLLRMLLARLPETVDAVYLADPALSPEGIVRAIVAELGLSHPGDDDHAVLGSLHTTLLDRHAGGRRVVVLIEEAQGMSRETLERVRLLTNLETDREKLLQIVLFGQPELDELLARHDMRQLADRIAHTFRLTPLSREETGAYLSHRLHAAGYRGPTLFGRRVAQALWKGSGGLLRRINILADKTLLAAFAAGTRDVCVRHVREAAADDQALRGNILRWKPAAALASVALVAGTLILVFDPVDTKPPTARIEFAHAPAHPVPAPLPVATAPVPAASAATMEPPAGPGEGYAIQLATLASATAANGLIEELARTTDLPPASARLSETANGPRWVVDVGAFPDRASAVAARSSLPVGLAAHGPLVRPPPRARDSIQNGPE